MSARYEISERELDVLAITGPEGTRYIDGEEIEARVIRQQSADIAALKDALADEVTANEAFRKAGSARDDEDMPTFCARLIAERDKYRGQLFDCELALKMEHDLLREKRAELAAVVAERDSYRDEFSGLCHTLSVGSEGRPEMTAADWRKRVDDGVEFLLRPLIAQRDELVAAYEFARHVVRDDPGITPRGALIRQSDEIDRLRARLAALAELEKAASEPVAWMWDDMLGISHTYVSPKRPTWPDAGASPEMEMAINVRPLYAAPLAPVAELERAAAEPVAWIIGKPTHGHEIGRYLAWNAGHVPHSVGSAAEPLYTVPPPAPVAGIREPTPEECERIYSFWMSAKGCNGRTPGERMGRIMLDAVRAVMWPKEGV